MLCDRDVFYVFSLIFLCIRIQARNNMTKSIIAVDRYIMFNVAFRL